MVFVPGQFPATIVDALACCPRFSGLVGAVVIQNLGGALSDTRGAAFVDIQASNGIIQVINGVLVLAS